MVNFFIPTLSLVSHFVRYLGARRCSPRFTLRPCYLTLVAWTGINYKLVTPQSRRRATLCCCEY
jgi:hypothetical protein